MCMTKKSILKHNKTPTKQKQQKTIKNKAKKSSRITKCVTIAILVRDKEPVLYEFLTCILNLEYDKQLINLYIRTNDNTDNSCNILETFISTYGHLYNTICYNNDSINKKIKKYKVHEWNSVRFKLLGKLRQESINYSVGTWYFVIDCDNFIAPFTLRRLIQLNMCAVAPMLLSETSYSNFHENENDAEYYKPTSNYSKILNRTVCGVFEVDVIHCTYLLHPTTVGKMASTRAYDDQSGNYEFLIFAKTMRNHNIPMHIDNRYDYGIVPEWTSVRDKHNGVKKCDKLLNCDYFKKFFKLYLPSAAI